MNERRDAEDQQGSEHHADGDELRGPASAEVARPVAA